MKKEEELRKLWDECKKEIISDEHNKQKFSEESLKFLESTHYWEYWLDDDGYDFLKFFLKEYMQSMLNRHEVELRMQIYFIELSNFLFLEGLDDKNLLNIKLK